MAAARKTAARKTVKTETKAVEAKANDALASFENISNATRDQFETFVAAFTENSDALRGQAEELLETCRDGFETANEQIRSASADLMNAAREETAEAVEFVNELARAKTVADALELQRDYWTNLFETRVARARDLTQASFDAARTSFEPLTKSMNVFPATGFEKFFPFAAK
jgi:hypothetical protein